MEEERKVRGLLSRSLIELSLSLEFKGYTIEEVNKFLERITAMVEAERSADIIHYHVSTKED